MSEHAEVLELLKVIEMKIRTNKGYFTAEEVSDAIFGLGKMDRTLPEVRGVMSALAANVRSGKEEEIRAAERASLNLAAQALKMAKLDELDDGEEDVEGKRGGGGGIGKGVKDRRYHSRTRIADLRRAAPSTQRTSIKTSPPTIDDLLI